MKIRAFGLDDASRSVWTTLDVPLTPMGPYSAVSAREDAVSWTMGVSNADEPMGGGPYEMHLTNIPQIVMIMTGYANHTMQSGEVRRSGPGDFFFVHGQALHHSTFVGSPVQVTTLSIRLPGVAGSAFK